MLLLAKIDNDFGKGGESMVFLPVRKREDQEALGSGDPAQRRRGILPPFEPSLP